MDLSAEDLHQRVWVDPRAAGWGVLEVEMRRVICGVSAGSVVSDEITDGHRHTSDDAWGK